MASAEAQRLIQQLEAQGLSRAGIGRALGRDSGMVSQVARGARGAGYGSNLVAGLQQLAAETGRATSAMQARAIAGDVAARGTAEVTRRTNAAGRTAAVRRGARTVGEHTATRVVGKTIGGTGAGKGATAARQLDAAIRNGQAVSLRVEIENNAGPGTRWITVSNLDAETWRYLLGLGGDAATMRQRLQQALDELAENGDLSSDVTATGSWQLNVEAA